MIRTLQRMFQSLKTDYLGVLVVVLLVLILEE